MVNDLFVSGSYNSVTMLGVRNIYNHMILKDCYEAGFISEDVWKSYLNRLLNATTKEDKDGNST